MSNEFGFTGGKGSFVMEGEFEFTAINTIVYNKAVMNFDPTGGKGTKAAPDLLAPRRMSLGTSGFDTPQHVNDVQSTQLADQRRKGSVDDGLDYYSTDNDDSKNNIHLQSLMPVVRINSMHFEALRRL
jgi:hypothetical protein